MATQWWLQRLTTPSAAAVDFHALNVYSLGGAATETQRQCPISEAGNALSIVVELPVAPGVGKSRQFQLSINGTPNGTLNVTISGTNTTGSATGTVGLSAADLLTIIQTPAGTPAASDAYVSIEFDPTTADHFCYPSMRENGGVMAAADAPRFSPLLQTDAVDTGTTGLGNTQCIIPFPGTVIALYVALETAPGAGKSWDFITTKDTVEQGSVLNIADANKVGNQTGLALTVNAGQTLEFKVKTATATPATTRLGYCVTLVPDANNLFHIGGHINTGPSAVAVNYNRVQSNRGAWTATETDVQYPAPAALSFRTCYVLISTTPGTAKSWVFRPRFNAADGNISVSISGLGPVSGNDTANIDTITAGQLLAFKSTPSGTPSAAGQMAWAIGAKSSGTDITITPTAITIPIVIVAPVITKSLTISPSPRTIPIIIPAPTVTLSSQVISPTPVAIPIVVAAPSIDVITVQAYQNLTRLLNPTDWGGTPTLILEIHGFTSSAGSPIKAHLYNVTDSAVVSGSQISSANTVLDRLRSSSFSLVAGSKEYEVRYGGASGATYTVEDAVLIVAP